MMTTIGTLENDILTDGNISDYVYDMQCMCNVYRAGMAVYDTIKDTSGHAGDLAYFSLCRLVTDYVNSLSEKYRWAIVSAWCHDGISSERYTKALWLNDCFDTLDDRDGYSMSMELIHQHALD